MATLTKQAIETISRKLQLPMSGREQDWLTGVADADRITEFLNLYLTDSSLEQDQKYALMDLILASCNKALQETKSIESRDWKQIKASLYTDPNNSDLIAYWALPGVEDVKQHFNLTPYIRSLR